MHSKDGAEPEDFRLSLLSRVIELFLRGRLPPRLPVDEVERQIATRVEKVLSQMLPLLDAFGASEPQPDGWRSVDLGSRGVGATRTTRPWASGSASSADSSGRSASPEGLPAEALAQAHHRG